MNGKMPSQPFFLLLLFCCRFLLCVYMCNVHGYVCAVRVHSLTNLSLFATLFYTIYECVVRLQNVKWKIFTISFFFTSLLFIVVLSRAQYAHAILHQCNIVSMNDNYLYGTQLGMLLDMTISMNMHSHTHTHTYTCIPTHTGTHL